jgi:hypothetical protein
MWKGPNMSRTVRTVMIAIIGAGVGAGLFLLGQHSRDTDDAHARGYVAGQAAWLRQGEARGLQEGRAFQVTEGLPSDAKAAARAEFNSGYAAGANDVFSGYDGGWYTSSPYLITLAKGNGPITYDIRSRTMLAAGVDYFLCPDTHTVCHRPHR